MTAFHHGAAYLLGCNLDQIGLAQLQRNHLIAEALAHLDRYGIDEGAPIPISFFGLQCEFLARLPVRNLEGSGAEDLARGRALGNRVPWQREFPQQIRGWRITFDHNRVAVRKNTPLWIGRS